MNKYNDELEVDPWEQTDEELNGYRPLDFDDSSLYDRRLSPSLEDELNGKLDVLEEAEEVAALFDGGGEEAQAEAARVAAEETLDSILDSLNSEGSQDG